MVFITSYKVMTNIYCFVKNIDTFTLLIILTMKTITFIVAISFLVSPALHKHPRV